jgi:hypothetical protein
MKIIGDKNKIREMQTWEEESGLISFLSSVKGEVARFNKSFEFDINSMVVPPANIDGDAEMPLKVGFVLKRDNLLLPEVTYCLYSFLKEKTLYGYIGIFSEGSIKTLKQLKPIKDFRKGKVVLYDWLRQLVRASCEKIIL